ncbi:MAG: maleylpyruvate isomerase N-terminal domain-containing protein [Acidimicrobiales bacterium]
MSPVLAALRKSSDRLRALVEPMDEAHLGAQAYPEKWVVHDVLSHIGSGAVIFKRRFDDALADRTTPDDFAPGVWDEWNAMSALDRRHGALASDCDLVERLTETSAEERGRVRIALGPMLMDFDTFVGLRLNEHALHTWDIEVVGDRGAVVPTDIAAQMVDRMTMVAQWAAKPTGASTSITVGTTDVERLFAVTITPDHVGFESRPAGGEADLDMSAEALIRLVYGRLDPDHTPALRGDPALLDELRKVFPGT